ncbi:MAG: DUF2325 domain-containing protein [Thermodesulfobacteriota bacterium]|nr:DUF2325 domain-containing protein [Thermodesulfobacteriota bacterium]
MLKQIPVNNNNQNMAAGMNDRLNNIWQIHSSFKCPVIGACLDINEHRKVLKRAKCQIKKLKPHQLHRMIMENLNDRNRISQKADSYLRYKYRDSIAELADLDTDEFFAIWKKAIQSGKMDGVLYIAAMRKDLPVEYLEDIFGETHMLCHANLAEVMWARRDAQKQAEGNKKIAKLLKQGKMRNKTLKKENAATIIALNETRVLLQRIKAGYDRNESKDRDVEKSEIENNKLKDSLRALENKYNKQLDQLRCLEREKRRLQIELFDIQSTNNALADEVKQLISQISSVVTLENNCDETCPQYQLCAKRILIVGGMTKMKHMYRQLVESSGGEFDYHDGYMNNGSQNIEALVMRSDLILCPVNCNSHGACKKVKKLCRKHSKSIKMLPSSSLSSISGALMENSVKLN